MRVARLARRLALAALALLIGSSCAERTPPLAPSLPATATSAGPKLLVCPIGQSAVYTATVGTLGALIEIPDGSGGIHSLRFPVDAVASATQFRITVPASDYLQVEVSAIDPNTGLPVSITFPEAARPTLSLSYARCGDASLGGQDLRLFNTDPANDAVLEGPFGGNDPAGSRVAGAVPHFSQYSIGTP